MILIVLCVFFFKQKTAYEMRISDWSSDVCSSDLWPRAILLNAWGTANMRTGGDDIAQALALIGARPTWEGASGRVTGFEIVPIDLLDRPRIDVTLKVSGFFRDAFPAQVALFDAASRAVQALDERSEEHTSELQSLMRISYAVFFLKK